jgi:hypothetical protein
VSLIDRRVLRTAAGIPANAFAFDCEMKPVQVCLSKSPLFDLQQLCRFKLLEVRADAAFCGSPVFGACDLAGKACVVGPGVFE